MAKLQKIGLRLIAVAGAAIFLALTLYAWRYTMRIGLHSEALEDGKDSLLRNFLMLLLAVEIVFRLNTWKMYLTAGRIHALAVGAAVLVTVIGFKFVTDVHGMTECDQLHVYMAAEDIARGTGERFASGDDYFYCSPHQLGLAAIYAFLMKLTGVYSGDLLRVIHAICAGLAVYMGFRIIRELTDDRRVEILYLLGMLSFIPLYLYVLFVYGETIGVCGAFCAIWLFLKLNEEASSKNLWYLIPLALCMAVTYMARKGLMVLWVAMLIVEVLHCMRVRKVMPVLGLAGILAVMLVSQSLMIDLAEKRMDADFGEGVSLVSWIAMGMQEHENPQLPPGSYNGYHVEVYRAAGYDVNAAAEISGQYIAGRLEEWKENPGDFVRFYKMKILSQWNEPTYGAFIMTGLMDEPEKWVTELYYGDARQGWNKWLDAFQGMTWLLVSGYFICLLSGGAKDEVCAARESVKYLLGLILIGGFCFSVIWETKSRYIYPYAVLAIPCAAISLVYQYDRLPDVLKNMRKKTKRFWKKRGGEDHVQIK